MKEEEVYRVVVILTKVSLGWFFSSYALFLKEHNLTDLEMNLVNALFMATILLLDPITGYLADKIGQKRVFVQGQVFFGLAMATYYFSDRFYQFLIAEFLAAIGAALMSGALESWLRNRIGVQKGNVVIPKVHSTAILFTIPTALAGSIIREARETKWTWFLSFVSITISALVSHKLLRGQKEGAGNGEIKRLDRLLISAWQKKPIKEILVIQAVFCFSLQSINMFWPLVLKEASGTSWWLGLMWIGIASSIAAGNRIVSLGWPSNNRGIALALIGSSIGLFAAKSSLPVIIGGFLLHEIGRAMVLQLLENRINWSIKDEERSTLTSCLGAAKGLGAASGLVLSGLATKVVSRQEIWIAAAIIGLLIGIYFLRKREEKNL